MSLELIEELLKLPKPKSCPMCGSLASWRGNGICYWIACCSCGMKGYHDEDWKVTLANWNGLPRQKENER